MKRAFITLLTITTTCFYCCKNQNENSDQVNRNSAVPFKEKESATVVELENMTTTEIVGLWKLYKTIYSTGTSVVERDNSFLEIKGNRSYEANRYSGMWFLSFSKDTSGITTLLTLVQTWRGSDEAKLDVNKVEKLTENNTTYLKLTVLSDAKQCYYIRQQ